MSIATFPVTSSKPTDGAVAPSLDALRARLAGAVVTNDHEEYDEARKVHSILVDSHPAVIVRAATANDVVEAVRFVRETGRPLAVRSGGHSLAAHSMVDDAVVIDLSAMRTVSIDPQRRTARVEAGATTGDLAGPAHAYGLALSTGDTSSVGLGGLTTGGGLGWMARKYGLAIDNVLSMQVVTADGELVTVNAESHADLFWAIRGGGGNFGIVTEFEFQLAPVGQVLGGALVLPASREVIRGYLDYAADAPDDLTTIAQVMHAPPAPFIPEDRLGELVLVVMACWTGDLDEGERALAPLRALAEPVADAIAPIPYPVMFNFTAPASEPHAVSIRSMFSNEFSDGEIDAVIEAMNVATSPMSMVQIRGLGGRLARIGNDETAFAHRDKRYMTAILGLWLDASEDAEPHKAWVEALWSKLEPAAMGVYVNFLEREGDGRIRQAYPGRTYARLGEVKRQYDPTNLFQLNQNIRPRA